MIVWMGYTMFRARTEIVSQGKDLPYNAFTAGIITSGLNPYFYLWWAAVGLLLISRFRQYGLIGLAALILAHWLCDITWLSTISVFIHRTKGLWSRTVHEGIFIACSLLLLGFGVWFVISGIRLMT